MKSGIPLTLPFALFLLILLLIVLHPGAALWARSPGFAAPPHALFGIAFLLGLFFAQSRVSFLSLLMAAVTCRLNHVGFSGPDTAAGEATILLAAAGVPAVAALFYRLSERGVFTPHGMRRALIVAASLAVVTLLPAIPAFSRAVASASSGFVRPMSPWIPVPAAGLLALAISLPFLIAPKEHESPALGPLLGMALLFVFAALGFRSSLWEAEKERAAMLLFMTGSGATLIWAVLESAWRHANIDELTGLPGRRILKYHLRCLGSSYAVAMVDIDHFKSVNDRYGHDIGDQVLRFVAASLQRSEAGTAYRYGGEEFVIVTRRMEFEDFVAELELLRYAISQREFVIRGPDRPSRKPRRSFPPAGPRRRQAIPLTVSIGVARVDRRRITPQEVLEAADKALYQAKENGRNQLCKAR
jgi:diguanylate cyclase (GGDEF)-like protein